MNQVELPFRESAGQFEFNIDTKPASLSTLSPPEPPSLESIKLPNPLDKELIDTGYVFVWKPRTDFSKIENGCKAGAGGYTLIDTSRNYEVTGEMILQKIIPGVYYGIEPDVREKCFLELVVCECCHSLINPTVRTTDRGFWRGSVTDSIWKCKCITEKIDIQQICDIISI
jgi:hypothetical protein